jgi:hypothetical protein
MTQRDSTNTYAIDIISDAETSFLFSEDEKDAERGCIGHLRVDFGHRGSEFWCTWFDHCSELKTRSLRKELNAVVNYLRKDGNMLHSLTALSKYCRAHRDAHLPLAFRQDSYGFKIFTKAHCYYIRAMLTQGDYNVYCYCYNRGRLEQYFAAAKELGVNPCR